VTVLSRCLQFNLKQLSPALIADRMTAILTAEGVASDAPALALIARAAHGSMRDALSLLDQAIAYGGGDVRDAVVRTMLGAVDTEYVYRIVDALIAGDGPALLAEVDAMALRSIAFGSALEDLASLFHRIAVAQTVPQAATAMDDAERVSALAARLAPETVQLAYQICVQGRADLPLAPDEATGFSMTLLRLLAFEPGGVPVSGGMKEAPPRRAAGLDVTAGAGALTTDAAGPKPPSAAPGRAATATATPVIVPMSAPVSAPTAAPQGSDPPVRTPMPTDPAAWPAFVAVLRLAPMAAQLAAQTELKSIEGNVLTLALPAAHKHLADRAYADKLKAALDQSTGRKWILAFEVGSAAEASLAAQRSREQAEQKARTEAAFRDEPFVQDALARFDAKIRPDSIKPVS